MMCKNIGCFWIQSTMEVLQEKLREAQENKQQLLLVHLKDPEDEEIKTLMEEIDESISLTLTLIELKKQEIEEEKKLKEEKIQEAKKTLQIGDIVEGYYRNEWYAGKLEEITSQDNETLYVINYFGITDLKGKVKENKVRPYQAPNKHLIKIGEHCLAVYQQDGKFYPGVVEKVVGEQVLIRFEKYHSSQKTNLEHIHFHTYDDQGNRLGSKKLKKQVQKEKEEKQNLEKQKNWKDFMSKQKNIGTKKREIKEESEKPKFVPVKKTKM